MVEPLSSIKNGLEAIRIGSRLDLMLDIPEPFYRNIRNRQHGIHPYFCQSPFPFWMGNIPSNIWMVLKGF